MPSRTLRASIAFFSLSVLPSLALAQSITNASTLIDALGGLLNAIVPFLIGLAVMLVVYGILRFIANAADEEKRAEARSFIIWGIIGIFVMVSVWGLVNILTGTFGFGDNTNAVVTATYSPTGTPSNTTPTTIQELVDQVNAVGSGYVLPLLIGIGFFIVIIGIVGYIREGSNEEKRAEGRMFIIWGVISIFIMLSIWGLVNILVGTFNLNNTLPTGAIPVIPQLQ